MMFGAQKSQLKHSLERANEPGSSNNNNPRPRH